MLFYRRVKSWRSTICRQMIFPLIGNDQLAIIVVNQILGSRGHIYIFTLFSLVFIFLLFLGWNLSTMLFYDSNVPCQYILLHSGITLIENECLLLLVFSHTGILFLLLPAWFDINLLCELFLHSFVVSVHNSIRSLYYMVLEHSPGQIDWSEDNTNSPWVLLKIILK